MLKVVDRGVASKGAKRGGGESKGKNCIHSSMDEISLQQNSIQMPCGNCEGKSEWEVNNAELKNKLGKLHNAEIKICGNSKAADIVKYKK